MAWSKVKNIILVILLGVNLILLGMVGWREYQSAQYDSQTLEAAVRLLETNGIAVDMPIPDARYLPILRLEGGALTTQERQDQAAGLVGTLQRIEDNAGDARVTYWGALGQAQLDADGAFSISFSGQARPQEDDPDAQARSLLEQLGLAVLPAGAEEQEDLLFLSYWQSWEGVPVFTCTSVVTFEEGSLSAVSGQRLLGGASPLTTEDPLTIPTILVRFLAGMRQNGCTCSAITGMTQGYSSTISSGRLTPVWAIETDTGEYYVNAVTGVFLPPEGQAASGL